MPELKWSDQAVEHVHAIVSYIAQSNPPAAETIGARLVPLGNSLVGSPNGGCPGDDGVRELVTVRPYILRYRVIEDRVVILGIRHSARAPLT